MSHFVVTVVWPEKQADFYERLQSIHKGDWVVLGQGRAAFCRVMEPVVTGLVRERHQCDVFCQKAQDFGVKKLLLADMDSTIVTSETLDDLSALMGMEEQVAAITAASMRGELDFTQSIDARVALIKGLESQRMNEVAQTMTLSPGAQTLVRTMRAHGAYTALVSGGFTFFTEKIASLCSFDAHHGNDLGMDGDVLDGTVLRPVLDKPAKQKLLEHYATKFGFGVDAAAAIGDGANDRAMISAAGLGMGYYPKPKLAACTDHQIWHNDLTALLFAQGITEEAFDRSSEARA